MESIIRILILINIGNIDTRNFFPIRHFSYVLSKNLIIRLVDLSHILFAIRWSCLSAERSLTVCFLFILFELSPRSRGRKKRSSISLSNPTRHIPTRSFFSSSYSPSTLSISWYLNRYPSTLHIQFEHAQSKQTSWRSEQLGVSTNVFWGTYALPLPPSCTPFTRKKSTQILVSLRPWFTTKCRLQQPFSLPPSPRTHTSRWSQPASQPVSPPPKVCNPDTSGLSAPSPLFFPFSFPRDARDRTAKKSFHARTKKANPQGWFSEWWKLPSLSRVVLWSPQRPIPSSHRRLTSQGNETHSTPSRWNLGWKFDW